MGTASVAGTVNESRRRKEEEKKEDEAEDALTGRSLAWFVPLLLVKTKWKV